MVTGLPIIKMWLMTLKFNKFFFTFLRYDKATFLMWNRLVSLNKQYLTSSIKVFTRQQSSSSQYYPINDDIYGLTDDQKQVFANEISTLIEWSSMLFRIVTWNGVCVRTERVGTLRQWHRQDKYISETTRMLKTERDYLYGKDSFQEFWKKLGDLGLLGITAPG